ncbi:MAG: ferric reductase-like transmembrane domain-containing protein [Actinobacteria bacterium]|nr:ferric reductase-like transmembrane domain-containing protein [Actinomycetota bacterium]
MNTFNLAWYTARAAGLVSWFLLAASISWGVLLHTKLLGQKARPRWLLDLHRFLGGLSVVFVLVHVAALLLDQWIGFGLVQVLVPFASSYRPVAVAWGIAGFYLLIAVELTSLLMKRVPRNVWHAIHLGSYALFVLATIHLFTAGTDATNPLVLITTGIVLVETLAFAAMRARGRRIPERPREAPTHRPTPPVASPAARAATYGPIAHPSLPSVAVIPGGAPERWTSKLRSALGPEWQVVNGWAPQPALVIVRGDAVADVLAARQDFPTAPVAVVTSSAVEPDARVALYDAGADRVIGGQSATVTAGHLRALVRGTELRRPPAPARTLTRV